MSKSELRAQMEAQMAQFQATQSITVVAEGVSTRVFGENSFDPALRFCKCGCEGSYYDHSMRLGESGQYGGIGGTAW